MFAVFNFLMNVNRNETIFFASIYRKLTFEPTKMTSEPSNHCTFGISSPSPHYIYYPSVETRFDYIRDNRMAEELIVLHTKIMLF
jgi:hypothetical protein